MKQDNTLIFQALDQSKRDLADTEKCIRAVEAIWSILLNKRAGKSPEVSEVLGKLRGHLHDVMNEERSGFLALALCLPESEALQNIREQEYKSRYRRGVHIMDLLGERGTWLMGKEEEFRRQLAQALNVDAEKLDKEGEDEQRWLEDFSEP